MEMPMEMQNQVMGYDRTATMFSPDGHLLQVEYAEKTVRLGSASMGFVCKDGVVVIADKRIKDVLVVQESANRVFEVDHHIIATAAGIASDARILVERSQVHAQQHRVTYDSGIEVESTVKELADVMQQFTQYGGARPFGVSIMIAGVSGNKAKVFSTDITGNYTSYKSTAIGENDERIKEELRKRYTDKLDIEEAIKLGMKIFKEILGKNFNTERFDVACVSVKDQKLKRVDSDKLKEYAK
jgi:proteasome alpha subunit